MDDGAEIAPHNLDANIFKKDPRHDRNLILFWSRANLNIEHLLCQEPWRRIQEFGSSIRWKFRVSAALKLPTSNIKLKHSGICNSVPLHNSYITSAPYVTTRGLVPPFISAPMSMAANTVLLPPSPNPELSSNLPCCELTWSPEVGLLGRPSLLGRGSI